MGELTACVVQHCLLARWCSVRLRRCRRAALTKAARGRVPWHFASRWCRVPSRSIATPSVGTARCVHAAPCSLYFVTLKLIVVRGRRAQARRGCSAMPRTGGSCISRFFFGRVASHCGRPQRVANTRIPPRLPSLPPSCPPCSVVPSRTFLSRSTVVPFVCGNRRVGVCPVGVA